MQVAMFGPAERSLGGMRDVAVTLRDQTRQVDSQIRVRLVDSGGGRGFRGYPRFAPALATVATGSFDLAHFHVASGGSTLRKAALARVVTQRCKPYVIHLHGGGYADFLERLYAPTLELVRRFFRNAARILVLGEQWRNLLLDKLALDPTRVIVAPNGVKDPGAKLDDSKPERSIIFIGRVARSKGVDLLLDVVCELLSEPEFSAWYLNLVGPKDDPLLTDALERAQLTHPGRITANGPVMGAPKERLLREASILVLPSRAEGLPLVLLEGMAAGLPCIVSDVGAVREVVTDTRDALVIPAGEADALATALRTLMLSGAMRTRLGKAARATWLRDYTSESMTRAVVRTWIDVKGNQS